MSQNLLRRTNILFSGLTGKLPRWLSGPLERWRYGLYVWYKHRYLGNMAKRLRDRLGRPLRILEIGALEGESAVVLARHGRVLTVDVWEDEKVKGSFLRRTKGKNIEYIQENSVRCLPKIRDQFDFIFVDGCHHYTETMSDIGNAKRLVAEGGIIAGDDLDLSAEETDRNALWNKREEDVAVDPKTGKACHPGVTLAIADQLGNVVKKMPHTFWAVRKSGSSFIDASDQ